MRPSRRKRAAKTNFFYAKNLKMKNVLFLIGILAMAISCKKSDPAPQLASLTTTAATDIAFNKATSGGTITSNGGAAITESGICWSKTNNTPTTSDSTKRGTTASGSFSFMLENLEGSTTYYVRAFATNSVGTAYGNVITFNTTVDTSKVTFTYNGTTVTYGVITSPATSRKWMDRNLGATRAATASTDYEAYGDLFQWGRPVDGHQAINWTASNAGAGVNGISNVIATSDVPGHNNFIDASTTANYDWRDNNNSNRWTSNPQGPCPAGWHVPSITEWRAEISNTISGGTATSGGMTNSTTAYSNLKLVLAGYRRGNSSTATGTVRSVGAYGYYWSSTSEESDPTYRVSYYILVGPTVDPPLFADDRAQGESVRCIKD